MKTLYHGTTKENFEAILDKRFGSNNQKIWNCSEDGTTYFYDKEAEEFEYDPELALQYAFENAQLTASTQDYRGDTLVVIEVEIAEEFTAPDTSCDYMEDLAVQVKNEDLHAHGTIKKIHTAPWDIIMKLFILMGVMKNENINLDLNPVEKELMEQLQGKDIFIEELMLFDYETKELNLKI